MKKLQKLQKTTSLNRPEETNTKMTKIVLNVGGVQNGEIRWWTSVKTTGYGGDTGLVSDHASTGWGDPAQYDFA